MTSPGSAIVLIGPMGAGKSSVGRRVARALGADFTDTDKAIAAAHGPIPELFARFGEPGFREIERAAVRDALERGGVVALGGGAILDADTRADLAAHRVVLLTVSAGIVAARLRAGGRPLLAEGDPVAEWKRIFATRRGLYEQLADITFDTSSGPLAAVVGDIVTWARQNQTAEENA